jgi:hypothetical protein
MCGIHRKKRSNGCSWSFKSDKLPELRGDSLRNSNDFFSEQFLYQLQRDYVDGIRGGDDHLSFRLEPSQVREEHRDRVRGFRDNTRSINLQNPFEENFDLSTPEHETVNRIKEHPELAVELAASLQSWTKGLTDPGLPSKELNGQERAFIDHYLPK